MFCLCISAYFIYITRGIYFLFIYFFSAEKQNEKLPFLGLLQLQKREPAYIFPLTPSGDWCRYPIHTGGEYLRLSPLCSAGPGSAPCSRWSACTAYRSVSQKRVDLSRDTCDKSVFYKRESPVSAVSYTIEAGEFPLLFCNMYFIGCLHFFLCWCNFVTFVCLSRFGESSWWHISSPHWW